MSSFDYSKVNVIAFDADDTLWVNETYFREAEDEICHLLSNYETENKIRQELFKYEIKNLPVYGYGVKGFSLSMVECALNITNNQLDNLMLHKILNIGKDMLQRPVELIDGVKSTLDALTDDYRLLVITKGDLLDQERKVEQSGLSEYFHHVEVMSEKDEKRYSDLLEHLEVDREEFLMVGNSMKSDVLPLINIGAQAIHVPFHTTWEHEKVKAPDTSKFQGISKISELVDILS